jgi:hypothetical protein
VIKERFSVPGHSDQTVDVVSIWDSTLKVNAPTDASLFKG